MCLRKRIVQNAAMAAACIFGFGFSPPDAATYRVLYADPSVSDVTAETLAAFENGSNP